MRRLPLFARDLLSALATYWLTYAATQVLANIMLAKDGFELRFIAPLSAEFGAVAATILSIQTAGLIIGRPNGTKRRNVARRFAAGLLTALLSTYVLVRIGGLQLNQVLMGDAATTMALLVSAMYLFFTGLLLFLDRFVARLDA